MTVHAYHIVAIAIAVITIGVYVNPNWRSKLNTAIHSSNNGHFAAALSWVGFIALTAAFGWLISGITAAAVYLATHTADLWAIKKAAEKAVSTIRR